MPKLSDPHLGDTVNHVCLWQITGNGRYSSCISLSALNISIGSLPETGDTDESNEHFPELTILFPIPDGISRIVKGIADASLSESYPNYLLILQSRDYSTKKVNDQNK